jgi:hypothetical protein
MPKITVYFSCAVLLAACGSGSTSVKCVEGEEMSVYGTFGTKYAEVYCDLWRDCDKALFDAGVEDGGFGGDIDACKRVVVNQETKHATTQICDRDCVFGTDEAEACLSVVETPTCEVWENGGLEPACTSALWECPEG